LFLQLPRRLTTLSNIEFRSSFRVDIGPITPGNKIVFVPNLLPNLSARRPEMTRPLPAQIGPIEAEMGHAKPSGSSVRHFVFFRHRRDPFLDWALPSRAAQ